MSKKAENLKLWKALHKDEVKEYMREYRIKNEEKIKQSKKRWNEENEEKIKQYRIKNRERLNIRKKRWNEENKDRLKQYRINNRERANLYRKKLYQRHKQDPQLALKIAARIKVGHAVANGSIIKGLQCESCFDVTEVQAHHYDYNKPFDITWLCRKCHAKIPKVHKSREENIA